ncbi:MAG: hypothetical protein ACOYN2_01315 [Patescibacteria group bacterium]
MRLTRSSMFLFGFYAVLFTALLFAGQTAHSPVSDAPVQTDAENGTSSTSEFH